MSNQVENCDHLVESVRKTVLSRVKLNPECYDEEDIERIKTNDWCVRRFVLYHKGDEKVALEQLDKSLKWRHDYGVNKKNIADCPVEFIRVAAVFPYNRDLNDRIVVHIRAKVNRKIPELQPFFHLFLVGLINKIDQLADKEGYTFVFDFTGK